MQHCVLFYIFGIFLFYIFKWLETRCKEARADSLWPAGLMASSLQPRQVGPAALGIGDASRRWFPGCIWSQGGVCTGVHVHLPDALWLGCRKVAMSTQGKLRLDHGFSSLHEILERMGGTSWGPGVGMVGMSTRAPIWTQNGHVGLQDSLLHCG